MNFRSTRRVSCWHFKSGTAWLLFSDTISHAELRGQYALEHSFFVPPKRSPFPRNPRRCYWSERAVSASCRSAA